MSNIVKETYGIPKTKDALSFLLELNKKVLSIGLADGSVVGPGLPPSVKDISEFITSYCLACIKLLD